MRRLERPNKGKTNLISSNKQTKLHTKLNQYTEKEEKVAKPKEEKEAKSISDFKNIVTIRKADISPFSKASKSNMKQSYSLSVLE